jgi:hypothetical protein
MVAPLILRGVSVTCTIANGLRAELGADVNGLAVDAFKVSTRSATNTPTRFDDTQPSSPGRGVSGATSTDFGGDGSWEWAAPTPKDFRPVVGLRHFGTTLSGEPISASETISASTTAQLANLAVDWRYPRAPISADSVVLATQRTVTSVAAIVVTGLQVHTRDPGLAQRYATVFHRPITSLRRVLHHQGVKYIIQT